MRFHIWDFTFPGEENKYWSAWIYSEATTFSPFSQFILQIESHFNYRSDLLVISLAIIIIVRRWRRTFRDNVVVVLGVSLLLTRAVLSTFVIIYVIVCFWSLSTILLQQTAVPSWIYSKATNSNPFSQFILQSERRLYNQEMSLRVPTAFLQV